MELLDLCYDVLIRILNEVDPTDLASLARTCSGLNNFIKGNKLLYKELYLQRYDDPRMLPTDAEPRWEEDLQRLVRWEKLMDSYLLGSRGDDGIWIPHLPDSDQDLSFLNKTALELLKSSPQRSFTKNKKYLQDRIEEYTVTRPLGRLSHSFFNNGVDGHTAAHQDSAQLHCLRGSSSAALTNHPRARSRVYDLRSYTDNTLWGPFRADGSMKVDWEFLEAIMTVLIWNTVFPRGGRLATGLSARPFARVGRNLKLEQWDMRLLDEPQLPLAAKDPYNITGVWERVVCFLDYNDLYRFNFGPGSAVPSDQPRPPLTTMEAVRFIRMRVRVTRLAKPGPEDNPKLPIAYFSGRSYSLDQPGEPNANSRIRGTVRWTPDGECRWTTISTFHGGEERWRSEGIQVGGPKFGNPVWGTWFDKDYDVHGPAGPTAYWKVKDVDVEDGEEDHWVEMESEEELEGEEWVEFDSDLDEEEEENGDDTQDENDRESSSADTDGPEENYAVHVADQ